VDYHLQALQKEVDQDPQQQLVHLQEAKINKSVLEEKEMDWANLEDKILNLRPPNISKLVKEKKLGMT